jgi:hypothetical protein
MRAALLIVSGLLACGEEQLCVWDLTREHRDEMADCEVGDTCVVVTGDPCFGSINESQLDYYNELVESARKGNSCDINECAREAINPRCVDGACINDWVE